MLGNSADKNKSSESRAQKVPSGRPAERASMSIARKLAPPKPPAPQVMLDIDDCIDRLSPETWREVMKRHQSNLASARVSNVRCLQYWPPHQRLALLLDLAKAGVSQFEHADGRLESSPLDVVLKSSPIRDAVTAKEQWWDMRIEMAAVYHAETLEVAVKQISDASKQFGVASMTKSQLRKKVMDLRKVILRQADHDAPQCTVVASLKDYPDGICSEMTVPASFVLTDDGIYQRFAGKMQQLTTAPIVINGREQELRTGKVFVRLAWKVGNAWQARGIPREDLADRSRITKLAMWGIPVTSNNAAGLVEFLGKFEAVNGNYLPCTVRSPQMGWHEQEGEHAFLFGKTVLQSTTASKVALQFHGPDTGEDQFATKYQSRGTLEEWCKAIHRVINFPSVMLGLYTAFAAPLLRICGVPSFIFDLAGETTTGKTMAMRIASSVYGCPCEPGYPESIIYLFNSTDVWRERASRLARDVCLFLDDTKGAKELTEVAAFVYMLSQGTSRGRGSLEGMREGSTWRSICFLTGERSATSFTNDGGTCVRVLSLWGSPFGKRSPEIATLMRETMSVLEENYGHAGQRFVQYLLDHRDQWPMWKKRFNDLVGAYHKHAKDNDYARRLAPIFAVIRLAAELAHTALELPWEYIDPIKPLYGELCREAAKADRAAEAMRHVIGWATANAACFVGGDGGDNGYAPKQPHGGWFGRMQERSRTVFPLDDEDEEKRQHQARSHEQQLVKRNELPTWHELYVVPLRLKEALEAADYRDFDAILKSWKQRGWLNYANSRLQKKVRIGRNSSWAYAINQTAWQAVMT